MEGKYAEPLLQKCETECNRIAYGQTDGGTEVRTYVRPEHYMKHANGGG